MRRALAIFAVAWGLSIFSVVGESVGAESARVISDSGRYRLENGRLRLEIDLAGDHPRLEAVDDLVNGKAGPMASASLLQVQRLADGQWIEEALRPLGEARLVSLEGQADARRIDDRFGGARVERAFQVGEGGPQLLWWAELRKDAHFAATGVRWRQGEDDRTWRLVLCRGKCPGAQIAGRVSGSPVVIGEWFLGCEHPMAESSLDGEVLSCAVPVFRIPGRTETTYTFAVGKATPGQLRRDFLRYVERRRARPYGLFVNYNSWWDISNSDKQMNEEECLAVIETFGEELTRRRGVAIESFVFDDGWDDPRTLWDFHQGFPRGFAPLTEKAKTYQSGVGTWLSPFGGYKQFKKQRLAFGREQGYEIADYGFSLAGERYFRRFREICLQMIHRYEINYFKFDGIAGNNADGAGEKFARDVEALIRLCEDLRAARSDIYLSITTGTWPSPYWLWFGDSVWRNGDDCGVAGWGSKRQQWITYRDGIVKRMIVDRAPLYPLNSLMTIPVCYARLGLVARLGVDAKTAPDIQDLRDEMWMGFASGTQLAELYVTPQLFTPEAWDQLAECIRWARENQHILVDTHWVAGDPLQGEIYGYAAWGTGKGILVLRNPSDEPRDLTFRLKDVWELPPDVSGTISLHCRYASRVPPQDLDLAPGATHTVTLPPFGILLWEGTPAQ